MTSLLVSVRSVMEAEAALAGGAHVIDVKEPSRGSLGRADDALVGAVIRSVAGRRPVSAACGELLESSPAPAHAGLSFIKCGLAGCAARRDWGDRLRRTSAPGSLTRSVAVAYADYQRAAAPPPDAVIDFAATSGWEVLLVDTWCKDGSTLLDWLPVKELATLRRRCHAANIRVALAGSLGEAEIVQLRSVEPDWFAVRGAACQAGMRTHEVCEKQVRRLVHAL